MKRNRKYNHYIKNAPFFSSNPATRNASKENINGGLSIQQQFNYFA